MAVPSKLWAGIVLCLLTVFAANLTVRARADGVKTDAGLLSGAPPAGGVTAYLGIPYAAPPVGDLRWRPPQPATHWDGVRKADKFGTSCMQNQAGSRLPWTEEFMTQGPIGEDCLFLNVWTTAKSANARQPVMFWIYGGGFNEGSSSVTVGDGRLVLGKFRQEGRPERRWSSAVAGPRREEPHDHAARRARRNDERGQSAEPGVLPRATQQVGSRRRLNHAAQ